MRNEPVGPIIVLWAIIVTALFISSFFCVGAASFEPVGRYLYMVALAGSIITVALSLVRAQRATEE